MPKAGRYDYPFFDIDHTLEKLRQAYDVIKMDEMDRENFAEVLDMSSKGGGFSNLAHSLDSYGLAETGKGSITITDLGKLTLYAYEDEQENAKYEAIFNVELFAELFSLYNIDATEEQIQSFLRNKAGLDIVKARSRAERIHRVYSRNAPYMFTSNTFVKENAENIIEPKLEEPKIQTEDLFKLESGSALLRVPKDDIDSIRLFKVNLDYLEKQFQEKNLK